MYITCILLFLSICIYIWRNICTNIGQISFSSTQPDCSVLWRKSLLYFLSSILLRKITRVGDIKKYFFFREISSNTISSLIVKIKESIIQGYMKKWNNTMCRNPNISSTVRRHRIYFSTTQDENQNTIWGNTHIWCMMRQNTYFSITRSVQKLFHRILKLRSQVP